MQAMLQEQTRTHRSTPSTLQTAAAVQQQVRAHDRYQAEFRLDYPLSSGKRTHYRITTYLFVPHSLAIRSDTYPKADFYRDIQNYVRLKIPLISLDELVHAPDSPLIKWSFGLAKYQQQEPNGRAQKATAKAVIDQLKFVRVILKASFRREIISARRLCANGLQTTADLRRIRDHLLHSINLAQAAMTQFRSCKPKLPRAQTDAAISNSYRLTDESVSLVMEDYLIDMFRLTNSFDCDWLAAEIQERSDEVLSQELDYRAQAGFRTNLQPNGDNEKYLFRISALKKFTSSVLYLSLTIQREGAALEQILFAFAAGLSMVFATVVAFFFQQRYGTFAFPVFVALVVGYMFKDRIKESSRVLFSNYLRRYIFDRRLVIRTLDSKQRLGYLREKMVFMTDTELPAYLIAKRNQGLVSDLVSEGQDEHILCYTKEVVLQANAFHELANGGLALDGITDIMRFDLRPYLRKMDDPIERRFLLRDKKLQVIRCPKVYYLNAITTYTTDNRSQLERVEHSRIVLTRKGIRRIDRLT